MKITPITKSWYKRRLPEKKDEPVDIEVVGFREEYNHLCKLIVKFESAPTTTYISRVIKDKYGWIVDGGHVSVRVTNKK